MTTAARISAAVTIVVLTTATAPPEPDAPTTAEPSQPALTTPGPGLPAWSKSAIWYEVHVPCFHKAVGKDDAAKSSDGMPNTCRGDLNGLREKLDYPLDLGVNTLYLTGLFPDDADAPDALRHIAGTLGVESGTAAPSHAVDQKHGEFSSTDRLFLRTLGEARERKLRVIVQLSVTKAWSQGKAADTLKRMQAVARRWIDPDGDPKSRDGVDGLVITRPDHLPPAFWKQVNTVITKTYPEVLLVADPADNPDDWIAGDRFHVAIDRRLARALRRFLTGKDTEYTPRRLLADLEQLTQRHPHDVTLATPRPISGPRLGRLLHALSENIDKNGGDEQKSVRSRPPDPADRWPLAAALQYAVPGAPVIYYGDEVGLGTSDGPADRPMPWIFGKNASAPGRNHHVEFARLIKWFNHRRNAHEPLHSGKFRAALADADQSALAIGRSLSEKEVLVLLNYGSSYRSVTLKAGTSGQLVGALMPHLEPSALRSRRGRSDTPNRSGGVTMLPMGGTRQYVNSAGEIRIGLDPASFALVFVGEEE